MKKPNQMTRMDIRGPFYLWNCALKNYFTSCEDDRSRKPASEWCERKMIADVLDVLEACILENGNPDKVMYDNGKQCTFKIFILFLKKDKRSINKFQKLSTTDGKIESYRKIIKTEFLAAQNISNKRKERKCIACSLNDIMTREKMVTSMVTQLLKCFLWNKDHIVVRIKRVKHIKSVNSVRKRSCYQSMKVEPLDKKKLQLRW